MANLPTMTDLDTRQVYRRQLSRGESQNSNLIHPVFMADQ